MPVIIDSPTSARIVGHDDKLALIQRYLTYTDKSIAYQIQKLKHSQWFDAERHADQLEELQRLHKPCLLKQDENGYYTLSGLASEVALFLNDTVTNTVTYPKPGRSIPWEKVPPALRPYQRETVDLFMERFHAAAELATGLGKSYILMYLAKELGLKTVVMAPTTSIANQLYDDFVLFLGKKRVGRYYGGKKDSSRLVTVAIHASLARIDPTSDDWAALSAAQVFIADESHLCPANTLYEVCTGLCGSAPYRFFLSGTQLRGDGADLLLRGVTGPVLKRMSVIDGVEQGWLAKPTFKVLSVTSDDPYEGSDPMKATQKHLLYNPLVNAKAGALATAAVAKMDHQVLILIDEVKQFRYLSPHLKAEARFAHGPLNKENEKDVPEAHRDADNKQLVKDFNDRKFPILVGTSAISLGTDVKSVQTLIYLQGGKSEVQIRQAVGRGTRKVPGKDECVVIDFDVVNSDLVHRHALERQAIFREIYPDVEVL
jgi:superfamily II DNA or RNA helicase